jgi:DNA-binding MarR family transcriptional regulator
LLALEEHGPLAVTEIATLLRQSHPLIIHWIKQLREFGFVQTRIDADDRRRTIVALTSKGVAETKRLRKALTRMGEASQALLDEAAPELFDALWRMEQACRSQAFADRLRGSAAPSGRKKRRTSKR